MINVVHLFQILMAHRRSLLLVEEALVGPRLLNDLASANSQSDANLLRTVVNAIEPDKLPDVLEALSLEVGVGREVTWRRSVCITDLIDACIEDCREEAEQVVDRQVACVQLLFQLIPDVNLDLLKDLLLFLSNVAKRESENRMNSENLGTLFSTHILCPRKLSPEALQSNHQLLSKAVTFMIQHAERLFGLPEKLLIDVENYVNRKDKFVTPKCKKGKI